jgi:tRNA uridine 5-carbamoylmethylation protein Kti12
MDILSVKLKSAVKAASQNMETDLAVAVKTGLNIIWDQTNLTHGSRAKKLKEIPSSQYEKIAVVFMTPPDLDARLASRPGKTIPMNVIKQMLGSFEMPTLHEGFSKIIVARNT